AELACLAAELDAYEHDHQAPCPYGGAGDGGSIDGAGGEVAPAVLGAVERLVGLVDQALQRAELVVGLADAGTDAEVHGLAEDAHRLDPRAQAVQQVLRIVARAVEQDHELVATAASGDAAFAHHLGDPAAERAQRLVPGGVAVAIVDLLEPVDVDHDRGERPSFALRPVERLLAELAHLLVIGQAGQAVVFGLPAVT